MHPIPSLDAPKPKISGVPGFSSIPGHSASSKIISKSTRALGVTHLAQAQPHTPPRHQAYGACSMAGIVSNQSSIHRTQPVDQKTTRLLKSDNPADYTCSAF
ncbi:hypothetical protein PtB15_3B506 [Puccinia triticina]|nr:hypothetical protein PtB15_3B506 [Puccinia triticina]